MRPLPLSVAVPLRLGSDADLALAPLRAGRFIYDVLGELNGWYKDKAAYAEFAVGKNGELSGFLRSMNDPSSSSDKPRQHYEHADFQAALLKWHGNMVLVRPSPSSPFSLSSSRAH